jgi:U6 snRNA-associated Sm-like protein LSm7
VGVLKGYDQLMNLVLDNVEEHLRGTNSASAISEWVLMVDPEDGSLLDQTRKLGLVVCRGPTIVLISPTDGVEEIENPFAGAHE